VVGLEEEEEEEDDDDDDMIDVDDELGRVRESG
jgi:hypothetical protein